MADDTPRLMEEIAELRRRLAETELRLERAQRIDSLGRYTADIVHDLSNLLTPLLAATTLLAYSVRPGTPAAALTGEIRTTAERSAALVQQILLFLRGEPARREKVNINAVLLDMQPLLQRLVGSDVVLALTLGDRIGNTLVDRRQLEQAILNLAANARDAMPAGGLLTIRTANVDIEHQDEGASGRFVALTITDTGAGMTPETLASALGGLFTTKGHVGTGLGLASVQHFAARSGGHVTVRSQVGGGTTVVIQLPRLPCSLQGGAIPDAPASTAGR